MISQTSEKGKNTNLTHRQIAEKIGVSRQLVGFALRGEGRMSDEMRRQILEVAHANGYNEFSNGAARSMAARKYGKRAATGVLAVLFPATFGGQPLSSVPYFMPFFEGIESEVIERGLDLMLCPSRPQGLPRLVREGYVDGVISILTHRTTLEPLLELDIPVIYIALATNRLVEIEKSASIIMDDYKGGVLATRHLLELGHRKIAYLGFCRDDEAQTKDTRHFQGYLDALHEYQVAPDDSLIDTSLSSKTIQVGTDAMKNMLAGKGPDFTGLVCHNDLLAMGAIRALQDCGKRVPEDVSVVGFDDVSTQYAFQPALTSISFPRHEMGRRAVQILLEKSKKSNEDTTPLQCETFPVELVMRNSTERIS
jgi:LacI family transcriptional regulator